MEIEPAGPSAKKVKLAASSIHEATEASPALAAKEANDPNPPTTTTTEGIQEPPPRAEAEEDGGEEMPDRISNLPDTVLGEIISLLPTREGARTQSLASRWRHLWRAAPLNLDYDRLPGGRVRQDVLVGIILSAHLGPGRRLCLPAPRLQDQPDAADAWLRSPALDNLQELDLYLGFSSCSQPLVSPPASTFRFSSTLCVATFSECHLPDHIVDTLRFPQLRKLALVAVRISECSLHSIITTCCPGLESLLLNTCFSVRRLRINSPTLISIGIHSSSDELIIEDAPSLQRLVHFGMLMEMKVTVVSAPKLEALGYISEYYGQSKIIFGSTIIQGLRIDSLTTVVCTVKTLAINLEFFDLNVVVNLMRCFPCLEKFYIKIEQPGGKKLWRRKHRNLLGSLDIRLKKLVLGCYQSIQPQVKFETFFVLNARMLESVKLEVDVELCDYNEGFFAEQHRMLRMEKRASRDARLCFTRSCPHDALTFVHFSDLDLTDPFACTC